MLAQLPAFLAAVAGEALAYELMVLVVFTFVLTVRRSLYRLLRWYRDQQTDDESDLRSALWKLLRG